MMKVVPSTYHQMVWYTTSIGTTDIRGDQAATRTISAIAQKKSGWKLKTAKAVPSEEDLPKRKKLKQIATDQQSQSDRSPNSESSSELETLDSKSEEEAELFHADPCHPEWALWIDTKHSAREQNQFNKFVSENLDVFACSPTTKVDPFIICHKLSILPGVKLVKPLRLASQNILEQRHNQSRRCIYTRRIPSHMCAKPYVT